MKSFRQPYEACSRLAVAPASQARASAAPDISLAQLPVGQRARVTAVRASPQAPDWAQALDDLGFVPGEAVQLLVRGLPGGDPLVVRVGASTYALRGAEAGCVWVQPA